MPQRPPGLATTFVGTANPEAAARNVGWVLAPVDQELATAVERLLAPVLNYAWTNGRPENNVAWEA